MRLPFARRRRDNRRDAGRRAARINPWRGNYGVWTELADASATLSLTYEKTQLRGKFGNQLRTNTDDENNPRSALDEYITGINQFPAARFAFVTAAVKPDRIHGTAGITA